MCTPECLPPFPFALGNTAGVVVPGTKSTRSLERPVQFPKQIRSEARPCPSIVEGKLSIVPVLPDVVDHGTGIDTLHPRTGRAVIEYTRVPAIVSEGAAAVNALETATELAKRP